MKRTPLRRRALRTRRPSTYRSRDRDWGYMGWIRLQPRSRCVALLLPPDPNRITPCSGRIEADHLGERALGRKADDRTCAPICTQHHRERTDHSGAFRELDQAEHRAWRSSALELVASWPGAPDPVCLEAT